MTQNNTTAAPARVYGYCRISRKQQNIERQIRNIKAVFPEAVIIQEVFTRTRLDRKEWPKLYKAVKAGDTIVFDSVSRMSRNSEDGIALYFKLFDNGINLVFLKERYINTQADKFRTLCYNLFYYTLHIYKFLLLILVYKTKKGGF